jgi:hypothetical protein
MSRNISTPMLAGITSSFIRPAIMADLTFRSGTQYVWTGPIDLVWNAQTYRGIGSLGTVGNIAEGTQVRADGTSISLSGIDPALLSDSLNDIQVGAPAVLYFALVDATLTIIGTPYVIFRGKVDKPTINPGLETFTISLALESPLTNLQRPNLRRYTSADQRLYYPDDTGFAWVELLNDIALRWGN